MTDRSRGMDLFVYTLLRTHIYLSLPSFVKSAYTITGRHELAEKLESSLVLLADFVAERSFGACHRLFTSSRACFANSREYAHLLRPRSMYCSRVLMGLS